MTRNETSAHTPEPGEIEIFSTSPQSKDVPRGEYEKRVTDVAQWSEAAGCTGILVYTDNGLVDPWFVADTIVRATTSISPLIAVQPIYMHPYSAAKMVATIAFLHGRRVHLNMLAGGFRNDLIALGDDTPHDERYDRTTEYTSIMQGLLSGDTVDLDGRYYTVKGLRLTPEIPPELSPGFYISGSSEAGLNAAKTLGATAVKYPKPPGEERGVRDVSVRFGVRIGVIARSESDEAWRVAKRRFPEDRKGQLTHKLSMKVSDSVWHQQLSELGSTPASELHPYWLGPFENYKTFCPYLVGSYDVVAREIAGYIDGGYSTFILDIPPSEAELEHIGHVFDLARRESRNTPRNPT